MEISAVIKSSFLIQVLQQKSLNFFCSWKLCKGLEKKFPVFFHFSGLNIFKAGLFNDSILRRDCQDGA
jgi:hypothetical protein